MNEKIKITTTTQDPSRIWVFTPFNPGYIHDLKSKIGDREWLPGRKCWSIPADCESIIRSLLKEHFGWDDQSNQVKIRIKKVSDYSPGMSEYFNGYEIARIYGRDTGASLQNSAVLVEGGFDSAGSRKHPEIITEVGTIVEITVPESIAKKDDENGWEIVEEIENEISEINEETQSNNINKSNLFKRAWEIARSIADELLINVKAAFSAALTIAWEQAR
jgi:hypothetical protein